MKVQTIDRFLFKQAEYIVSDGRGGEVILTVDYKHNGYAIHQVKPTDNSVFLDELSEIAADLLKRKHGVNFAEK